jgi:outer membrane protein OmpA-like peptidoglycan-associated protein
LLRVSAFAEWCGTTVCANRVHFCSFRRRKGGFFHAIFTLCAQAFVDDAARSHFLACGLQRSYARRPVIDPAVAPISIRFFQGEDMKFAFRTLLVALAAVVLTSTVFAGDPQVDRAGYKDYPGIPRVPGFILREYGDCTETAFDAYKFWIKGSGKNIQQSEEGHKYFFRYRLKQGLTPLSPLQIHRNYQNAARSTGGKVLIDENGYSTIQLSKGGKELWMEVHTNVGYEYDLTIIEKEAMTQEVAIDATAMASSIADTGSVAIYGINFDTASSVLKPESEPAIDEIAKLLTDNPTLKVYIVGHTDMVGDAASNVRLSQARAQSVIAALVSKHGIAAARLLAFGNGPYAPVATNKTDDGRAKNRRVELVEIATKSRHFRFLVDRNFVGSHPLWVPQVPILGPGIAPTQYAKSCGPQRLRSSSFTTISIPQGLKHFRNCCRLPCPCHPCIYRRAAVSVKLL